jgi:hypothetical protein
MNPSRASPTLVKTNPVSESARSVEYATQAVSYSFNPYVVFTSVLAVTGSNLSTEPVGIFRQISGLMCTQEWERFCAFFCMVFKVPELRAQIFEGSVVISTRAKQKDKDDGKYCSYFIYITTCSNTVYFTGGSSGSSFAKLLARKKSLTALSPVKAMSSSGTAVKGALNFEDHGEYTCISHFLVFSYPFISSHI